MAEVVGSLTHRSAIAEKLGLSLPRAIRCGWLAGRQSNKTTPLLYHDDAYSKYTLVLPSEVRLQQINECIIVHMSSRHPDLENLQRASALEALRLLAKPKMYFLSMPLNPRALYRLRGLRAPSSNSEHVDGHLAWEPEEQLALSWPTMERVGAEAVSVRQHFEGGGDVLTKEVLFCPLSTAPLPG